MLKEMLQLCYVNYKDDSPFESYFNDFFNGDQSVRNDRRIDTIVLKDVLQGRSEAKCDSMPCRCHNDSQLQTRYRVIDEIELMQKAYQEFIAIPLSKRDEAVKMLAWRLI